MGFKCGIVGLPNVGEVAVPDPRIDALAKIAGSAEIVPTKINFVDIAGLVRGASKGEGLGNQFLGHIREVDAIVHVLRCFEDSDITHVEGGIDPLRDAETVETELMLADLDSLEKRVDNLTKKARGQDKEAIAQLDLVKRAIAVLSNGKPARTVERKDEEEEAFKALQLITAKPVLYACNVEESAAATGNELSQKVEAKAKSENAVTVAISAKIESEIAMLPIAERKDFLDAAGLTEPGLDRLIRKGYELLGLITYFTAGPKEARAWTIVKGMKAPQAAGVIHTDFEKGFIRAETIAYADYVACKGEAGARDAGKLRLEGKDYVVQDGDVMHFRFAN